MVAYIANQPLLVRSLYCMHAVYFPREIWVKYCGLLLLSRGTDFMSVSCLCKLLPQTLVCLVCVHIITVITDKGLCMLGPGFVCRTEIVFVLHPVFKPQLLNRAGCFDTGQMWREDVS